MEIKTNNNELNAVLTAIYEYMETVPDEFTLASLKSFVSKVNGNSTTVNWLPEEKAVDILQAIEEIEELEGW